jgi:hypothetical protein
LWNLGYGQGGQPLGALASRDPMGFGIPFRYRLRRRWERPTEWFGPYRCCRVAGQLLPRQSPQRSHGRCGSTGLGAPPLSGMAGSASPPAPHRSRAAPAASPCRPAAPPGTEAPPLCRRPVATPGLHGPNVQPARDDDLRQGGYGLATIGFASTMHRVNCRAMHTHFCLIDIHR